MNRYYYDLHIHSCLSPCADDDMTVNNIAGMAAIKGLGIIALTDHNSCANCPAFFKACKRNGVVPVAGMELTTAEEVHLLCLFPTLETAMEFDDGFKAYRVKIKNRTEIF
ncbi:MAG: PHP domain-containing protein, partial [Clostridia bacterium]|nr:PHP domain-containing protein [Clostridia bacterium]